MTGSSTRQAGAPGVRSGAQLSSPGGATMTGETISATTIINGPAEAIFAILADPARHAAIDGTGWVREPLDSQHLTEAGQVFPTAMYNDNAPGGHYRMANRCRCSTRHAPSPGSRAWTPATATRRSSATSSVTTWPPSPMTGRRSPAPSASDSHSHSPRFAADHLTNSLAHLAELAPGL
jgi:hypothetical protein